MPDTCPTNSLCNIDPVLVNGDIDSFDAHLLSDNPAIDAGSTDSAPADDIDGRARDNHSVIGALEY